MNAASVDIKDMINGQFGLSFAVNLFVSNEPASPDDVVTIYDTPGLPPGLSHQNDDKSQYPAFQVRTRNVDFQTGYALAENIRDFLHGYKTTINGTKYELIRSLNSIPFQLKLDDKRRVIFINNFEAGMEAI